jgi:CHASE2 domain-containing sensor protein
VRGQGQRPPLDDIVIIAIDNPSLQTLGRWPWPRTLHADLLNTLAQAKPKAIAYDVLFVEPDADPKADVALGTAMKAAGPVFLPLLIEVPPRQGSDRSISTSIATGWPAASSWARAAANVVGCT